jgi:hypothetical protein
MELPLCVLNVPSKHSKHFVAPGAWALVPGKHGVHCVLPAKTSPAANVPSGQSWHSKDPGWAEKNPGGHGIQLLADCGLYHPARHFEHVLPKASSPTSQKIASSTSVSQLLLKSSPGGTSSATSRNRVAFGDWHAELPHCKSV